MFTRKHFRGLQVEELRGRDAENGMKIAQVLEGFISRKVVKQTVMTVVYGVTRYGGRLQIEKRLKEIDEFPKVQPWGNVVEEEEVVVVSVGGGSPHTLCDFIFSLKSAQCDRLPFVHMISSIWGSSRTFDSGYTLSYMH